MTATLLHWSSPTCDFSGRQPPQGTTTTIDNQNDNKDKEDKNNNNFNNVNNDRNYNADKNENDEVQQTTQGRNTL